MLTFWGVVVAITVWGGLPTVGGLVAFERWRSGRRNRAGACAACDEAWTARGSGEPFLLQGRVVCSTCAARLRKRLPWQFGAVVVVAGIGTALAVAGAADGRIGEPASWVSWAMVLLPPTSTLVMAVGTVQWMKLANRRAQRRIAKGEFPTFALAGLTDRESRGCSGTD